MGKVSFSELKVKLIRAIEAISAVELLKAFLVSTKLTSEQIDWKIAIHLAFVFSGSFFAASDWISDAARAPKPVLPWRLSGGASGMRRYMRVSMATVTNGDGPVPS